VGARFSAPVQIGRGTHPASYTLGTGSFPGLKRPGRGVDHPPLSSAEVKERVELYLYSTSGPLWPVLGQTLPLPLPLTRLTHNLDFPGSYPVHDTDYCLLNISVVFFSPLHPNVGMLSVRKKMFLPLHISTCRMRLKYF